MVAKPTHLRRKTCLLLYILCAELSRFLSRRLQNVYKIYIDLPYIILGTEINFQNVVTFVLVKLDTKFKNAEFLEKTSLTTLLNFNIFLTI